MKNNFLLLILTVACISCINVQKKKPEKRIMVENSIREWINENAFFPNSYKEIKFKNYEHMYAIKNDVKIDSSDEYFIFHKFKLKSSDSIRRVLKCYFILDDQFNVKGLKSRKKMFGITEYTNINWKNDFFIPQPGASVKR